MRYFNLKIQLERLRDGRLRVCSDDLPGLILSGMDSQKIMNSIVPAIDILLNYKQRSAAGRKGGLAAAASKKARRENQQCG